MTDWRGWFIPARAPPSRREQGTVALLGKSPKPRQSSGRRFLPTQLFPVLPRLAPSPSWNWESGRDSPHFLTSPSTASFLGLGGLHVCGCLLSLASVILPMVSYKGIEHRTLSKFAQPSPPWAGATSLFPGGKGPAKHGKMLCQPEAVGLGEPLAWQGSNPHSRPGRAFLRK